MREAELVVWAVTESIKIMIFYYGVLGMEVKNGWKKYGTFLYLGIGIPVFIITSWDDLYFRTLWGLVLLFSFFEGSFRLKIRSFFVQYIAISAVDILIWSLLVKGLAGIVMRNPNLFLMLANCPGILFWMGILVLFRKIKYKMNCQMEQMSWKYYCLILAVFFSMAVIAGGAQAECLDEMSGNMKESMLFSSAMALVLLIFVVAVLMLALFSQSQLRMENEMSRQFMEYQKKYYSELIVRDEEMRRFRHDFNKHIIALGILSEEGDLEGVRKYLEALDKKREDMEIVKTGNPIADYFLYAMISDLMEVGGFEYNISGKFPPTLPLSDIDLSVLLGNALDNAKEALLKTDGERKFGFLVMSKGKKIEIEITNSCKEGGLTFNTSKKDVRNHGYGLLNMQSVVNKYDGDMKYSCQKGRFTLTVRI